MGAFFLYHRSENIKIQAVQNIFERNGFQPARLFELEDYTLLLYHKQLIEDDNFVLDGSSAVFCTGTPVYRGLSYRPTLTAALSDFKKGTLEIEQFLGNFCLIFFHNRKFTILLDELTVQHVFIDQNLRRLSSSFLALLSSFDHKLNLNRSAFYEKITTGVVMGPDTLVEGITQVTPQLIQQHSSEDIQFIHGSARVDTPDFHRQGFDQSVDIQIQTLKAYVADVSALCADYRTDIGLSGGFDSRLLLALFQNIKGKISAYTHATAGVHDREVEIVKKYINGRDIPFTVVPTKPAWQYAGIELEQLLKECMYFFDGRSGSAMSTFSPIYTRSYRINVMGANRLNLNGSGGEIYRNFSHTGSYPIKWFDWMKSHVYFTNIQNAVIQAGLMDEIHRFVTGKIGERLQIDLAKKVDYLAVLRYFAEISMVDSKGIFANAQNQLGFYLTPFIEKRILRMAYQGLPYIGMTGAYEAKIITKIDRELASADSSYGYPLNAEPFSVKVLYWMKGLIPDRINNIRYSLLRKFRDQGKGNLNRYQEIVSHCEYMRGIDQLLNTHFPEIRWLELVRDWQGLAMVTNLGTFLQEFESNLNL